jgi:hypothetical protein
LHGWRAAPGAFDHRQRFAQSRCRPPIEPLFITDPFEASIAASSLGQHVIADGVARGVEPYFARLA